MFNIIWVAMISLACLFALINNQVEIMVNHIPANAEKAFSIALRMVGPMAFWLGVVKIAEDGGLVKSLVRLLRPVVCFLFPDIPHDHPAMGGVMLSIASNMLGLNNAATPIAIRAMQALQKINPNPTVASDAMCLFMCINASSVQLLPTTAIAALAAAGSTNPMQIVTTTLLATAASTVVSISACLIMQRLGWFKTD
mgnify:CR=1 FL=1